MKVKQLRKLLKGVDKNLEVLVMDEHFNNFEINTLITGEVTFSGACDEVGNLLPDGNDEKYDVNSFLIQIKKL